MGRLAILLVLGAALSGCGRAPVAPAEPAGAMADARPLIADIRSARLDTSPAAAILTATGLAPLQGYWEGALVPVESGDPSVLAFGFRAAPPQDSARPSTPRSREVTVARALAPRELAGIRLIRVTGARNGLSIRR